MQACWDHLPLDVLEHIGGLLTPEAAAAGRLACSAWRLGLSAGVTSLRPNLAAKHSLVSSKGGSASGWARVPQIFPAVKTLDLRRCKQASESLVRAVTQGVPQATTVHLRVGVHCSVNKRKHASNIHRLMKALRIIEAEPRRRKQTFLLEFYVLDGPFWWNENLGDRNVQRMFGCVPANVQVQTMDFTVHVCQNLSRDSFRVLSTITSLRELTLSNSSTVSSTGFAQLSSLTNLEELHIGDGMPVTDAALASTLASMSGLRSLTLVELQRITDAGIAAVAQLHLPALKRIGLHGFGGITDEAMLALRWLPSLRVVVPRDCPQISDVGLAHLAELPALRVADVRGCFRVTPAGASAFRTQTGRRAWVLLGNGDAAAAAQTAAADALAAAAVLPQNSDAQLPFNFAIAAGGLVAGAGSTSSSRGCPLYAKYYDKVYPHSRAVVPPAVPA